MKKGLFLTFLCASVILSNAQRLPKTELDQSIVTVHYQFTQQVLSGNTPVFLTDTTVLEIGNVCSVYYNWSSTLRDSLYNVKVSSIDMQKIQSVTVIKNDIDDAERQIDNMVGGIVFEQQTNPESIRIYKNRQTNTITSIDGNSNEMFLCEEIIPPLEWTFFPDTLTVLNYLCYKAETKFRGRKYTAWFTMDIPLDDGPWKMYGLSGLIFRLEDENQLFTYEAIGLTSHFGKPIVIDEGLYTRATNEQIQRWIENKRRETRRTGFLNGTMLIVGKKSNLNFHKKEIGN